jgi:dephospho-CoA kinase
VTRDVALYGFSGSGKSTVATMMTSRGYQHVRTGKACRDICAQLFESDAKTILNQVTDQMRVIDPTVWLRAALRDADPTLPIVFDSMRFPEDYEYMQAREFFLVRIELGQMVRLERLTQRGQIYDPQVDDLHQTEVGLLGMKFDFVIDNAGSCSDLEDQVAGMCALMENRNHWK